MDTGWPLKLTLQLMSGPVRHICSAWRWCSNMCGQTYHTEDGIRQPLSSSGRLTTPTSKLSMLLPC